MDDFSLVDAHFCSYAAKCTCAPACLFDGALEMSRSFNKLSEAQRIDYVRIMLLVLAAPPGYRNELQEHTIRGRKRTRDDEVADSQAEQYSTVKYCMKGNVLCRNELLAIIQLSSSTLHNHVSEVSPAMSVLPYTTKRGMHRN